MDYPRIQKNYEKHGFSTRFFPDREAAVAYFTATLEKRSIGFGGSLTLRQMGLYQALATHNAVVWHMAVDAPPVRRLANQAEIYLTSVNAATETGQIVNIDNTGNRVSMTAFGPEICYFIVGRNKIVPTLEAALERCRNVAAPRNAQRLGVKTPCARNGDKCYNCDSPDRICRLTVIHDRAPRGMLAEIIFIDEELGL